MNLKGKIKDIIPKLLELKQDIYYNIQINEIKSKRSLEQNKMLWKLIHDIAKETGQEDYQVYCSVLEKADALSDYIITAFEMSEELRKSFRGVYFVRTQEVNEKECYVYKVYLGSSKMDTKEMNELLNATIQLADELGVKYE